MASSRLKRLYLLAVRHDLAAQELGDAWLTPCLHCRSKVGISRSGEPDRGTTLEHIVPRAWFGKRAAAALCARVIGAEDPRNLALACARCNHSKGRRADASGPQDEAARRTVESLIERRLQRWRD